MTRTIYLLGLMGSFMALLWGVGYLLFMLVIFSLDSPLLPPRADAAIILTGGSKRIQSGLELLEKGIVPQIFISGVNPDVKLEELLAEHNPRFAEDLKDQVTLGKQAYNTESNATEAADWMKLHKIKHAILVTATYHMPRALYEFHALAPELQLSPAAVVPEKYSPQYRHFWWLGLKEYNKLIVRWTRNALQIKSAG